MSVSVYKNGNYLVSIKGYGTTEKRCFRRNEELEPEFPDSLDIKLSNRCSTGCSYCHECSVKDGDLADFDKIISNLSCLPRVPIEIALGGGNLLEDDESKELLKKVLLWCWDRNYRANITLNEDIITKENIEFLSEFRKDNSYKEIGIGISLRPGMSEKRMDEVIELIKQDYEFERNSVFHIILGLFPPELLKSLIKKEIGIFSSKAILFLGYKQFGRAKGTELPREAIKEHERIIKETILKGRCNSLYERVIFGFDNLALEQLDLEKALLTTEFRDIYFGPEFSCSMYVDAVKGEYAKTSRSEERVSWNDIGILNYFQNDKSIK